MKQKIYRTLIELTNGPFTAHLIKKFTQSKLSRHLIKSYAKFYRINLDEMLEDINSYANLHTFFTRKLKENIRAIDENEDSVISPVDGVLEDIGEIDSNSVIYVKNKTYSISEMLGSSERAGKYAEGTYMILYLSPAHYHRIHSPINAKIMNRYSLGSKSYPVNRLGLKYGDSTLSKNFRTVTELEHDGKSIAMVKVGAMFINSVEIINQDREWNKGEEVAYFSFGSTVVLLFEKNSFRLYQEIPIPSEVRVGQALGQVK
ncbi:phosphatidylserine decarboxylase [Lederbergia wuyishanensis]|uniref:phosphatidylserine decarboxylase n=1 Tax=Lederbergia wuyishanensis TaxID=1347903 RepID=A0ABU0D1L2_9BACI|nr:phosphatidylserine decarboxylase [Lederbergia wuyishanensis]MCJ8006908.1 phosphatidylserine decarboxylase [Lederbergia wuyishanensis]MDQ0342292.1 phosphatidylserine decarboxylase [Lederbergia wuyishanensis]